MSVVQKTTVNGVFEKANGDGIAGIIVKARPVVEAEVVGENVFVKKEYVEVTTDVNGEWSLDLIGSPKIGNVQYEFIIDNGSKKERKVVTVPDSPLLAVDWNNLI